VTSGTPTAMRLSPSTRQPRRHERHAVEHCERRDCRPAWWWQSPIRRDQRVAGARPRSLPRSGRRPISTASCAPLRPDGVP
jgi:hypothetical protein